MMRHLYVHVPFCARRCSYCDFSIAVRETTPTAAYLTALEIELRTHDRGEWNLDTVYLGGGTPSRLGGAGITTLLNIVREAAAVTTGAEITIEANPDDVNPESAAAWNAAGVNRVSLGAQSFDARVLEWMHRTHSSEQIGRAVTTLRDAGIGNISIDLIFSLPPQVRRDWHVDLDRALALAPDHVSLYGLTVEPHTPLARWRERGNVTEAPDEQYETEFLTAHERLAATGFEHYEVSNFAIPGHRSRHNSAYWSNASYVGVGPSAHGFDGTIRRWNVAAYTEWERRLLAGESVMAGSEYLTEENRAAERVYLALRTNEGLRASDAELTMARPWVEAGWARIRARTIVLTASGLLRLDALATSLTLAGSR